MLFESQIENMDPVQNRGNNNGQHFESTTLAWYDTLTMEKSWPPQNHQHAYGPQVQCMAKVYPSYIAGTGKDTKTLSHYPNHLVSTSWRSPTQLEYSSTISSNTNYLRHYPHRLESTSVCLSINNYGRSGNPSPRKQRLYVPLTIPEKRDLSSSPPNLNIIALSQVIPSILESNELEALEPELHKNSASSPTVKLSEDKEVDLEIKFEPKNTEVTECLKAIDAHRFSTEDEGNYSFCLR